MTTKNRTEQIRAYLDGTMTPQQVMDFELAMFEDPNLAEFVDAERLLRIGLRAKPPATPDDTEKGS